MEEELTLGDIYDDIAEKLAAARTKALMGERQEALGLLQGARLDYTRFRDVLAGYPGCHALEHAFEVTMATLCAELEQDHQSREADTTAPTGRSARPRKKSSQAA